MFKKQMCSASNQPKTRWVFVGTNSGVFRYFPGKLWNPGCSTVDLHDTTKSPWFVQGIASPKDVLVMIDTSGSIIGITLSLIKSSVAKLMTTLAGNDFFNIFVFNQKAEYLEKSCPGLIQATPINKQMAVSWLDKLKVHNSSSFDVGFEFGFSVLNQSEASNTTTRPIRAGCNSIILLFTDGGAAYPGRTFQKWNLDKQVRVFTYSVGKPFSSTTTLNEMACNNRGE
uniref:VWFA domain-containing protein n=1 Tax=Ciona savignyi TaxID=51511 RepID=H2ZK56_CIOSA